MDHFSIEQALDNMIILVDSREHPNMAYHKRIKAMGVPVERKALSFGDYSVKTMLPDNTELSLEDVAVVERKMSLDEVCGNFGRERKRFVAEFERAKESGARVYLLIENANFKDMYEGNYRSKYAPESLVASFFAWIPRYNMVPIFCRPNETGKIIHEIMKRELKEYLTDYDQ